jgi:homoserine kinase
MPEASAPASSANLGPGFDTLALALDLRCVVRAEPADQWKVEHLGPYRPAPGTPDAVQRAAQEAVGLGHPLHLTVTSEIPVGRGLGSSAAAAAAGALAAWKAAGLTRAKNDLFEMVAGLEGHADNAAAVVYGGLRAVTTDGGTHVLTLHPDLQPVVAVPDTPLNTSDARASLADDLPRDVVVRSLQRLAALIEGLRTADPDLLAAAAGDEIHELPRSALSPLASELISASRSGGALYACWSGAGSSVLALTTDSHRSSVVDALTELLGGRGAVITPAVDHRGAG